MLPLLPLVHKANCHTLCTRAGKIDLWPYAIKVMQRACVSARHRERVLQVFAPRACAHSSSPPHPHAPSLLGFSLVCALAPRRPLVQAYVRTLALPWPSSHPRHLPHTCTAFALGRVAQHVCAHASASGGRSGPASSWQHTHAKSWHHNHINPLCAPSLGLGIALLAPFPPVLAQEIYALAAQGDNAHAVRYYAAWEEVRCAVCGVDLEIAACVCLCRLSAVGDVGSNVTYHGTRRLMVLRRSQRHKLCGNGAAISSRRR
jgi:hypothetical protein